MPVYAWREQRFWGHGHRSGGPRKPATVARVRTCAGNMAALLNGVSQRGFKSHRRRHPYAHVHAFSLLSQLRDLVRILVEGTAAKKCTYDAMMLSNPGLDPFKLIVADKLTIFKSRSGHGTPATDSRASENSSLPVGRLGLFLIIL
jgi:hypothetical protein